MDNDLERVVLIALVSAVLSTPIAVLYQSIIMFILSADTDWRTAEDRRRSVRDRSRGLRKVSSEVSEQSGGVSRAESRGVDLMDRMLHEDWGSLIGDIQMFRKTLAPADKQRFDKVWGLTFDSHDDIVLSRDTWPEKVKGWCNMRSQTREEAVLMELGRTRQIVAREKILLDDPTVSLDDKNKRLMYLFVKDLMDGVNGAILDAKDRRDSDRKRRIQPAYKAASWVFLTLTAVAMLLYIYLFAMGQSQHRQNAWFRSFLVWLVFEIVLCASAIVFVKHVLLPLIAVGDVRRVKKSIVSDIIRFNSSMRSVRVMPPPHTDSLQHLPPDNLETFNAAQFLFPSHRLAAMHRYLPESGVVLQYSTPWPKRAFGTGRGGNVKDNYDMRFAFLAQAISRVVLFLLVGLVSIPDPVQDMLIEVVSTMGLGYLVILHVQLFRLHPVLVLLPALLLVGVVYIMTSSCNKASALDLSRTFPSADIWVAGEDNSSQGDLGVRGSRSDSGPGDGGAEGGEASPSGSSEQCGRHLQCRRESVAQSMGMIAAHIERLGAPSLPSCVEVVNSSSEGGGAGSGGAIWDDDDEMSVDLNAVFDYGECLARNGVPVMEGASVSETPTQGGSALTSAVASDSGEHDFVSIMAGAEGEGILSSGGDKAAWLANEVSNSSRSHSRQKGGGVVDSSPLAERTSSVRGEATAGETCGDGAWEESDEDDRAVLNEIEMLCRQTYDNIK